MELIVKGFDDAVWLKEYFAKRGRSIYFSETIFQNQKQYTMTISEVDTGTIEIQEAIVHFIMIKKRNDWVKDILSDMYYFKEAEEQDNITEIVDGMFKGERKELTSLVGEVDETRMIHDAVSSFIRQGDSISFDSFITFRLKDYFQCLTSYIEMAIDEYKMEQDYQVFIQMLRDYVKNRKPRKNIVRIYFEEYGEFFHEDFEKMTKKDMEELIDRRLLTNHPVYIDSVTIAPLLSLAPASIYLYTDNPDVALIRTIQNIFEERITLLRKEDFWNQKCGYTRDAVNDF
ncbi:putative sporulation protein YtxC [Heyndrickxia acidicola]|uniref:Sporulation protein YtxC n=1 Tax=Heyndrickxia acidicola TaxID=209389 RepID=A0ABU6MJM6_9BACI|nr:putative sporulation protein YtxC [Heyndrickxia acidicola]MED1204871.1 putative sporulation protein YtxC [Heyndrickxia acidicola]